MALMEFTTALGVRAGRKQRCMTRDVDLSSSDLPGTSLPGHGSFSLSVTLECLARSRSSQNPGIHSRPRFLTNFLTRAVTDSAAHVETGGVEPSKPRADRDCLRCLRGRWRLKTSPLPGTAYSALQRGRVANREDLVSSRSGTKALRNRLQESPFG
jgi:hypothetical protein